MRRSCAVAYEPTKPNTDVLHQPTPSQPMPDRGPRPQTGLLTPWRMLLQIGSENTTTVGLQVTERILVGRGDDTTDHMPDLDLASYGGLQNGVSRAHAVITQQEGTLFIEDLGSTNGTRINGFQLVPKQSYRLRDGDELEFGRIRVVVRFVRSPKG